MKCDVCGSKNFTHQDRCIPCFKRDAVLVHNFDMIRFDSRQDANLRDSIERHAQEYPEQRELFQFAVTQLEDGLPGAALMTVRDARSAAKKARREAVK